MPRIATIAALIAAAAVGWYLATRPPTAEAPKAESRPQPVVLRPAEARPMPVRLTAVGTVQALAVVPVRPRVEGEVVKVHFAEGDEVAEGAPLFSLDARAAEAARRQAEASLLRDRAQLERARADLARYTELLKVGSATQQKLEQATADAAVLEAAVKADQAAIDNARLAIEYAAIRAPVPGRTGAINAKLGSLARPTDALPMVTITRMRPVTVAFSVAESNLPRIRAALAAGAVEASVGSAADPALDVKGRLTFIDSAIDTQTGTIGLKATFANDDTSLWPGQFVTITLVLGTEAEAVTVPAEAVQTGQQGNYVFVPGADNRAELRPVTIDRIVDGVAVIAKGLAAGDKVVVEGQMRLAAGIAIAERGANPPAKP
ncbi:efflux RND transporter periplasmic adaptor subunit [Magnetospirillum sp. UT-4]|uniref:efflux RND transporter periplasmic adaptor subunit n=1 Tax=Magnetospirillum sp. UT-4 TaxID=2681467 RepID=UPI00137EB014|nr:efflux RND transporter periplasmic adaptor subunit [Magnetospirillum sp. UT-4]CAA7626533.1 putative multidrug efflux system, subunit A [Magnetospirillum sp. UT-4]